MLDVFSGCWMGAGWVLDVLSGCWMGAGCFFKVLDGCWILFLGAGWVLDAFLGSGPGRGRSPVEWGDFPSIRTSVHPPLKAQEPARQALDPASQASEPTWQASEPKALGAAGSRPENSDNEENTSISSNHCLSHRINQVFDPLHEKM